MSIEEVERILDETQEAVEYQRVGVAASRGSLLPASKYSYNLVNVPRPPTRAVSSHGTWRLSSLK